MGVKGRLRNGINIFKLPANKEEWEKVSLEFDRKWNFPSTVGAVDGKHVVLQCPGNSGSTFCNYKGTFIIALLGVVDANYCFLYCNVGCQGRISDGVFKHTEFYQKLKRMN